ncbi:zinc finger BED domain-containing protein RICESLEEPER 2-like [Citrus clementina]|uniref:zinc finger BED domain-containing protein RICESLEEPER 2-like n=2 Tax=Citrus TaxID=2706 RepID=UPI000CECFBE9|nr:zinc finger BED domain-containing protein RICESLEEPER 2-like [Citrus x clementina]
MVIFMDEKKVKLSECFTRLSRLIMSDLDPDPIVQINPQTSSNVNAENPQTHSISGGTKRDSEGQPKSSLRQTSRAWDHFTRRTINGEMKAVCNHCGKGFAGQQSSRTSHLLNHIDRCPKRIQESAPAPAPASSPSQASKVYKKKDAETSVISAFDPTAFDKALARQKIARIIIMHELPLRFVEYEGFRDLMSFVQPLLGDITSKVSITTDMWTSSNQKNGYMVVTAHFIDNSWTLRNRILRFIYVPSPHTAEAFPMSWLSDGLDAIGDGIEKVRNSVNYWTSSPKRIELFEDTANRQLKLNCSKSLVLDCKTKWNSTYLMLEVALIYKDVFTRLKHRDNQYKHLPTEVEWELARVVCEHLKPFYTMTEMFSSTKYPTASLFFPIICEIRLSLNAWLNSSCDVIKNMVKSMLAKFGKYWMKSMV